MPPFLPAFGPTEGPLGFPMLDRRAWSSTRCSRPCRSRSQHAYRKLVTAKTSTELSPTGHPDVGWITTESLDRTQEVVIAKGMDESQFGANPLVTFQHTYSLPPVGRSLWR